MIEGKFLYFYSISLVFEPSIKNISHRLQFKISVSMYTYFYTTIIDEVFWLTEGGIFCFKNFTVDPLIKKFSS